MKKVLAYRNCFICGKDSKTGLKLDFEITEAGAQTSYTPQDEFEGFKGVVHGGILCALLDEVMWKSINGHTGVITMTAKMEVKFKRPALVGTKLLVKGSVIGRRKKFFEAQAVVSDTEGNILAEASGLFVEMDRTFGVPGK